MCIQRGLTTNELAAAWLSSNGVAILSPFFKERTAGWVEYIDPNQENLELKVITNLQNNVAFLGFGDNPQQWNLSN